MNSSNQKPSKNNSQTQPPRSKSSHSYHDGPSDNDKSFSNEAGKRIIVPPLDFTKLKSSSTSQIPQPKPSKPNQ